jgi:hypothetical protein
MRAQRWRDVSEQIAAAGASAVVTNRASGVGAQPVTASVALRIDALHGETRQILHNVFPQGPARCVLRPAAQRGAPLPAKDEVLARIVPLVTCGVKKNHHNM